jgi:site-specific DNA recombinase
MTPKRTGPRAVGIYARISQDGEDSGLGVRRQQEDCAALAERRGWPVAEVYTDNDTSAYNGKPRPAYRRMVADLEAGTIDGVVVWHLDRLHRRPKELEEFVEVCQRAGVTAVATVTGDLDVGDDDGLFQARILTAVAAKESGDKGRRLRRKHLEMARNGRSAWGVGVPWGFRYDPRRKTIVPVPRAAREVRQVFERFAAGWTLRAILRDLNDRGVVGLRGRRRWAGTSALTRILDNPTYAAYRHYGDELTEGTWKPIIDRRLWEAVQAIRATGKASRPALNRSGKGTSELSGLLFCSCGAPMWRSSRRDDRLSTYECARSAKKHQGDCRAGGIAALRTENHVRDAFLAIIAAPYAARVAETPLPEPEPDDLEARLAKVERKIELLVEARLDSPGPGFRKAFEKRATKLEAERAALVTEQAARLASNAVHQVRADAAEELRARLADLPAIWNAATAEERGQMLKLFVERVGVLPTRPRLKEVRITWAS